MKLFIKYNYSDKLHKNENAQRVCITPIIQNIIDLLLRKVSIPYVCMYLMMITASVLLIVWYSFIACRSFSRRAWTFGSEFREQHMGGTKEMTVWAKPNLNHHQYISPSEAIVIHQSQRNRNHKNLQTRATYVLVYIMAEIPSIACQRGVALLLQKEEGRRRRKGERFFVWGTSRKFTKENYWGKIHSQNPPDKTASRAVCCDICSNLQDGVESSSAIPQYNRLFCIHTYFVGSKDGSKPGLAE